MKLSGGGDQDVRPACDLRHVLRPCVTVDDRGVFMHEHHGHGAADDQRTPDDSCLFTADRDLKMMEDFHGRFRSAGRKTGLRICKYTGEGQVCTSVDIFGRVEHAPCLFIIQMLWKGAEHKDSMNGVVLIEPGQSAVELLLRHILRQYDFLHFYIDSPRPLNNSAFISQVIWALTDPQYTECRGASFFLQCRHILPHLNSHRIRHFFALQYNSHSFLTFFQFRKHTAPDSIFNRFHSSFFIRFFPASQSTFFSGFSINFFTGFSINSSRVS